MPAPIEIQTVVGPTAAGKTAYAIELAQSLNGEIISVDSRQIYRGMIIGTGQPTATELKAVPQHLINTLDPQQKITAGRYAALTYEAIDDIISRGRTPILCGGTGLYIRAIRLGLLRFDDSALDVRQQIADELQERGARQLFAELQRVDPSAAEKIDPANTQRLTRALEIIRSTGKAASDSWEWDTGAQDAVVEIAGVGAVRFRLVGLNPPRQILYDRINQRVELMIESGWLSEVEGLLAAGVPPDVHAMQSVGYAELIQVLQGNLGLEEAIDLIQRRTRKYARRQITWFRREPVVWIASDDGAEESAG